MKVIKKIWREPLIYFLAFGYILFLIFGIFGQGSDDEIIVNRAALRNYLQYQAKEFDVSTFDARLDGISPRQRDELIENFVDQEVLYRVARAQGLETGDDVIRQRLIQKALFLIDSSQDSAEPSDAELRRYYQEHRAHYADLGSLTFTHVFFSSAIHGPSAERLAREAVATLNRRRVGGSGAMEYGDRFPFLTNYVGKAPDIVDSHMGSGFTKPLMAIEPSPDRWQGPFRSRYGWHAVLLIDRSVPKEQPFEMVRDMVREEFISKRTGDERLRALAELRKSYRIRIDLDDVGPRNR